MKENIKMLIIVLVALAAWEMLIKKFVLKSEYEETLEEIQ